MKKHSKALVFFAVSKKIPIVYSADRGRAGKTKHTEMVHTFEPRHDKTNKVVVRPAKTQISLGCALNG